MAKMKLGVIFGGMSTEHDVSVVSGISIIKKLKKDKYEIYPIYISKDGKWHEYLEKVENIGDLKVGDTIRNIKEIENPIKYLEKMDCIFPVLHGLYGEDGTIQGLLELVKIPYVGCKVLASSVAMDKVYTKIIFERAGLNQAKYVYVRKYEGKYIYVNESFEEEIYTLEEVCVKIQEKIKYPMFVKPSNSGSSVGISKVNRLEELKDAIEYASEFDRKILVEEGIKGREVECAVLGNEEVVASCVGEVVSAEEFYSFDSKYKNSESVTVIPADLPEEVSEEIRKQAKRAFKAISGSGLSRVDFFVEEGSNRIIINEINTLPGFTQISMYPKLFEQVGIEYSDLLDRIVELSFRE